MTDTATCRQCGEDIVAVRVHTTDAGDFCGAECYDTYHYERLVGVEG
jgi:hypothetical protein